MSLGEFEPEVWIPGTHPAARRGTISLGELAGLDVIYGPRRLSAVTYDAWLAVLRAANPRFDFTDPPFRHSPPITLAFTATNNRPAAALTGPRHRSGGLARTGGSGGRLGRHGSRPGRGITPDRCGGPDVAW